MDIARGWPEARLASTGDANSLLVLEYVGVGTGRLFPGSWSQ
jgi:hypothetical protein